MESSEPMPALEAELASLRAANAALTDRLARLETALAAEPVAAPVTAPTESRRDMLKLLAGAGAGAVAATVFVAHPAAAADGQPLQMGQTVTADTRPTRAQYVGTEGAGVGFLFQSGDSSVGSPDGKTSQYGAALAGWATAGDLTTGVYGFSNRPTGFGVVGASEAADGTGVRARGPRAAIGLVGTGIPAPPSGTIPHSAGEIQYDQNGDLWVCVADGGPGTWRKLAGPKTAGAFHAIDPTRVYDSRVAAYTPNGRLARTKDILVSVKDARNGAGAVTTADIVPVGAVAVAYNLTVSAPQGANFLSITPGDATGYVASALNFSNGIDLANGGIVKIDASRQVRIFCGDQAGSTQVILDITGYYR